MITLLFVVAVVILLVIISKENIMRYGLKKDFSNYKFEQINLLIDQYRYKELRNPKNYGVNIELGILFESIGKLKEAENEYINAINKAGYNVFEPRFMLADLYIKQSRLNEALLLIDPIKEYPNQNLILSKARFYEKLAKAYYQKNNYATAIELYRKAFYYRSRVKKKLDDITQDVSKTFIARAEELKNDPYRQEEILLEGIKLVDTPQLLYKLAMFYKNKKPKKTLDILSNIQRIDPTVINYDEYYNLLDSLKSQAQIEDNSLETLVYTEKLKKLQRFLDYNITFPSEFYVEPVIYRFHRSNFKFKFNNYIYVTYNVINKTPREIPRLFAYIEVFNNNKLIYKATKRVVTRGTPLSPGQKVIDLKLKVNFLEEDEFVKTDDISVFIYLTKNKKVKGPLFRTISIFKY